MIFINVNFQRTVKVETQGKRPRLDRQHKNVQGLQFDVAKFDDVTPDMIRQHPKAPARADGWVLHGWCLSVRSK